MKSEGIGQETYEGRDRQTSGQIAQSNPHCKLDSRKFKEIKLKNKEKNYDI